MEYHKEKKQELKKVIDMVREKFPEIGVKIGYKCLDEEHSGILYTETIIYTLELIKRSYLAEISICATENYFRLPCEEKLSCVAHELGHVLHSIKSLKPKYLYRLQKWSKEHSLNLASDNVSKHKQERLKKWYLLEEIYADTKAAKKGYGKGILTFLKRQKPSNEECVIEQKVRVKNLEKILGNA